MKSHLPLALLALLACEGPFVPPPLGPPPPPTVASVQLAPDSATIVAGDTLPLIVTLRDSSGAALTGRTVAWQSADARVAIVSSGGVVLGIDAGATTVRATANGHADSVTVFVTPIVYTTISAGAAHTCATASNQHLYCWGDNASGQTGTGTGDLQEPTPRLIADPAPYSTVVAGGDHTCGLTAGGGVACWGKNDQGQLGRGGAPGTPSLPAPVATPLRFTALAAGASHTCGLTADGGTYCWGLDFAGQLGDGGTTFRDTPRRAISDVAFATLVAGANHTCALAAGGGAYCWGANALGQLGDSTRANRGTPVPVAGGLSFARLSAGGAHTCALTAAGAAYCWGGNIAGQLGTGTADSLEVTPQPVTGGLSFRVIAAGGAHTCGLTADSLAYCWGNDSDGELGDSAMTTQPIATPVLVRGGLRFADLRAGASHTCGITGTRLVYCWGSGLQGQLGQLFPHSSAVPLRVAGQP
ncbi:MAG: hypothetical protein AUH46_07000 [Gemmatimonadetes bacterium 13_1_40CM_70_15]|nr:MAG: hypothetical protein AUH46_07000 [Gemmatimonadetes bacterium 13_1_40CM_70_15]